MPAGGKRRKAAKKMMKNGEAHNSNHHHHHHGNSSSTHCQGSDDQKSFDDRKSDSGEVVREEEEPGVEGEAVDYEDGSGVNSEGSSEEAVEVIGEENAVVVGISKQAENGSEGVDVDVVNETLFGVLTSEGRIPSNGSPETKEVAVEEEKTMIEELEQLKGQDVSSALESIPGDEIPKPVHFVPEEAIRVEGPSVQSMKEVVSFPQEINVGFGGSRTSDMAESGLMNADLALKFSDEKEKCSSFLEDQSPEKIETETGLMDEDKSSVAPAVASSHGVNAIKILETSDQLEEKVVAPAVTTNADTGFQISDEKEKFSSVLEDLSQEKIVTETGSMNKDKSLVAPAVDSCDGIDAVKIPETSNQLEEQIVAPAVTTTHMVESVEKETIEQSNGQVGSVAANTIREVDNVKEMKTQKQSMDQPSMDSNNLSVRRTSWMGCCGIFEVFSGAKR